MEQLLLENFSLINKIKEEYEVILQENKSLIKFVNNMIIEVKIKQM